MFKEIKPRQIEENLFKLIGEDWMLITAGNLESFNTMTASWGGFGVLWSMNVSFIFVRPVRYTWQFIEKNSFYTLSYFEESYRKSLQICGEKSGRDTDKVKEAGLTPFETANGNVCFREAKLVIECKKLYFHDINPSMFMNPSIESNYPGKDYHRMYTGEIVNVMKKSV
ncbi:MAG TPA: flavin reductase [bacterium]|nr:flavin reductase [bacterium]